MSTFPGPPENEGERPPEAGSEPPRYVYEPDAEETVPPREQPVYTPVEPAAAPRRNWGRRILSGLLLALLLFGAGFGAAYALLYLPVEQERESLAAQVSDQQATLDQSNQALSARADELANLQAAATASAETAANGRYNLAMSSLRAHVLTARLAVAENDALTARQALQLAEEDLAQLQAEGADQALLDGLAERLAAARAALEDDNNRQAAEQLRRWYDNIQLVSQGE